MLCMVEDQYSSDLKSLYIMNLRSTDLLSCTTLALRRALGAFHQSTQCLNLFPSKLYKTAGCRQSVTLHFEKVLLKKLRFTFCSIGKRSNLSQEYLSGKELLSYNSLAPTGLKRVWYKSLSPIFTSFWCF